MHAVMWMEQQEECDFVQFLSLNCIGNLAERKKRTISEAKECFGLLLNEGKTGCHPISNMQALKYVSRETT